MSTSQLKPADQAIVRKSLIDRLDAGTRLIRFFDLNARAKHGVPLEQEPSSTIIIEKPVEVEVEKIVEKIVEKPVEVEKIVEVEKPVIEKVIVEHKHERAEPQINGAGSSSEIPDRNGNSSNSTTGNDSSNFIKKLVTAAVLLTTGAAGTALILYGLSSDPVVPKVPQDKMSPLQYLEDKGDHLP